MQVKCEDRLLGRGIFYGADRQEATNVVGEKIFIPGGGNSAGQTAMFLSSYSAEVKTNVSAKRLSAGLKEIILPSGAL